MERRRPSRPAQDNSGERSHPLQRAHPAHPQWEGVLDRMLGEAVQQTEWQNLKGKGQKLNLDPPAGTPPDQVMAHKIMEDNDVVPAWIAERKRILARIEAWRTRLAAQCQAHNTDRLKTPQARSRQTAQWRQELAELNQAIAEVNMGIPIWRMEVLKLDLRQELQRAGMQDLP